MGLALVACGDSGGTTAGQTDSNTGTETQGDTTQGSSPTDSGNSQSGTSTGIVSGNSESLTGDTTATNDTTDTTVDVTITGPGPTTTTLTTVSTLDTGESTDDTDSTTSVVSASDTDTSTGDTGDTGDTSTSTDDSSTGDDTSTTEPECIPALEICNDLDDDCNNKIDDVDVGMDGVCDCLSIALVGNEGANPSSEFQTYLQDLGTTTVRINSVVMNDINDPLTPVVLDKYDIVIFDWLQRNYTPEEATHVRAWIEDGGGLMTMTGFTNVQYVADRPNAVISTMGLSYNTSKGFFSGPVTQFAPHPINMGLTSLTFAGGLYIDVVNDGVGVNTTIMTLNPGQQGVVPVGVVQDRVKGRLFVFGDEWVEFDSQWMNMPDIKQFWVQTLSFLGPKDSCVVPQ
jgi:uncharacterized membrane protein